MRTSWMVLAVMLATEASAAQTAANAFRPPSVPLVTHDPYFSVWSPADKLTDTWSSHWTGATLGLCGLVRIDGKTLRFAGADVKKTPALEQVSLQVWPTRTVYTFEGEGVQLTVTFMSPLLPDDLDVLGRSVTYISFEVVSKDGKKHDVSIYVDCSGEWAVNTPEQEVAWSRCRLGAINAVRIGTTGQPVLAKRGDDLRIDWGYLYLAIPGNANGDQAISDRDRCRSAFVDGGTLPESDDMRMPRPVRDQWPALATMLKLGETSRTAVNGHVLLAYDDLYAIELFERRLRPY